MEAFIKHIGVRGLLALIFSIGIVVLAIMKQPGPTEMCVLLGLIIGFYFGGRQSINDALQALKTRKKASTRRK